MQCQTIQPGAECTFWSKQGCIFEGNSCQPIVEQCEGCENPVDSSIGRVCKVCPSPKLKWVNELALCNFATHRRVEVKVSDAKTNPLKASKKASGGGGKKK